MLEDQRVLALTDENQRLVNLNFLDKIKTYRPKGMLGLYEKLEPSLKNDEEGILLTYEGMKRAIARDIKGLNESAGNPEKLHKWLNQKHKKNERLQIRITANQFLLNNILSILGMQFEDLFDRNQLPGQTEEESACNDIPDAFEDVDRHDSLLLEKINSNIELILQKYAGDKFRKNYFSRFTDFFQFIFFFNNFFIPAFRDPKKNGFSLEPKNEDTQKKLPEEIVRFDYIFVQFGLNMIHKNDGIHKLFRYFSNKQDSSLGYKRLICSLFMVGILEQLMINLIQLGIKSRKPIFHFIENDTFGYLGSYNKWEKDNSQVLEKVKEAHEKTLRVIRFMLKNTIMPDDAICEKFEITCVNFFGDVSSLLKSGSPNVKMASSSIKEMEDYFSRPIKTEMYITFSITSEKLNFLEEYIVAIEEAQIGLKPFLRGNYDVVG